MLVDAFTFFNELDMLEFRLRMLEPVVDKFVIVEANRTFSGRKKPFIFDENSKRFEWIKEKIMYHRVIVPEDMAVMNIPLPTKYEPEHPCWRIEILQRNAIRSGCWGLPDEAIVMMGDVDEIPSRDAVTYAVDNTVWSQHPVVFRQSMFYYNLRFMRKELWHGTIITDLANLRAFTPQRLRECRNGLPAAIDHGGWHLSFFGDQDKIRKKIEAFSHQELNKEEFKNPAHVAYCIETGEDLFDRDVPIAPVKKEAFPDYFKEFSQQEWW